MGIGIDASTCPSDTSCVSILFIHVVYGSASGTENKKYSSDERHNKRTIPGKRPTNRNKNCIQRVTGCASHHRHLNELDVPEGTADTWPQCWNMDKRLGHMNLALPILGSGRLRRPTLDVQLRGVHATFGCRFAGSWVSGNTARCASVALLTPVGSCV